MSPRPGSLPVRTDDPDTTYASALKAAMGASRLRPVVPALLQAHGPATHDELIAAYHRKVVLEPDTPRARESGIRIRLQESAPSTEVGAGDVVAFPSVGMRPLTNAGGSA